VHVTVVPKRVASGKADAILVGKAQTALQVRLQKETAHARVIEQSANESACPLLVQSPAAVQGRVSVVSRSGAPGARINVAVTARLEGEIAGPRRRARQRVAVHGLEEECDIDLATVAMA
jgi:hypothetical protein